MLTLLSSNENWSGRRYALARSRGEGDDIEVFRLFSSRQNKAKQCLGLKQFGEAVAKL